MEHGPLFYLTSWFLGLFLSIWVLATSLKLSFFQKLVERDELGRSRSFPRGYRLGGLFLAVVFLILVLADTRIERSGPFIALCIGSIAIIAFSLADDLAHTPWPWHLALQCLLGSLLFLSGMRFQINVYFPQLSLIDGLAWASLVIVIVWVVLVMNALNWADGIDGLMPGVAAISFGTLFLLSLRPEVNQPAVAILSVILFSLSLSLLLFNWYPARILAGTGGAYFFGFMLAALGLYAGMKIATIFLVLVIPFFDAIFVILRRLFHGRSLFRPDEGHLHHLLRSLGWSVRKVSLTYLLLTLSMSGLALSMSDEQKLASFIFAGGLIGLLIWTLHHFLGKLLIQHS